MQLPKRKAGDLPEKKFDPHITQERHDDLEKNLEKMIKIIRPKLAKEVERLAQFGDFSENVEYQIAKGKLRGLNYRIDEVANQINRAIIITNDNNKDQVSLGHYVTVEVNGKQNQFQILGSSETNPTAGIVSRHSPIGKALLGARVGETVHVQLTNKTVEYKILEIE